MKTLGLNQNLQVVESDVIDMNSSNADIHVEVEDNEEYYAESTQYIKDDGPLILDEELFAEHRQTKWNEIRALRNSLLDKSDWTQMPDVTLTDSDSTAWTTYRQELRDMIDEDSNPFAVTWPEKPV